MAFESDDADPDLFRQAHRFGGGGRGQSRRGEQHGASGKISHIQ
jgi:hypothetical protein